MSKLNQTNDIHLSAVREVWLYLATPGMSVICAATSASVGRGAVNETDFL